MNVYIPCLPKERPLVVELSDGFPFRVGVAKNKEDFKIKKIMFYLVSDLLLTY
jgi:hypothetical protein